MISPLTLSRFLGLYPLDSEYRFSIKWFYLSLFMFVVLIISIDSILTLSSALYVISSTLNTAVQNTKLGHQRKFTCFPPTYLLFLIQIIMLTLSRKARGKPIFGVCTTWALLKHHELIYLVFSAETPEQIHPLGFQILTYCLRLFTTLCIILAEFTVSVVRMMYISEVIPTLLGTMIMWILSTIIEFLITVWAFTKMPNDLERKKFLMYRRMIKSNVIKDEQLLILEQDHRITFTACGFFEINNRLIFELITGVSTILVIFLQFTLDNTCPKSQVD